MNLIVNYTHGYNPEVQLHVSGIIPVASAEEEGDYLILVADEGATYFATSFEFNNLLGHTAFCSENF